MNPRVWLYFIVDNNDKKQYRYKAVNYSGEEKDDFLNERDAWDWIESSNTPPENKELVICIKDSYGKSKVLPDTFVLSRNADLQLLNQMGDYSWMIADFQESSKND